MPAETHSHRGPWSPEELRSLVLDRLAEAVGADPEQLRPDEHLEADLGLTDLGRLDLVELIEEEVGERTVAFALDDDDLAECRTVHDLVEAVMTGVAAAAGSAGPAGDAETGGEAGTGPESP